MTFPVLWVEDDPNDILLGERALRKAGFSSPMVVRDGEEALAYLSGKGGYDDRTRHPLPSLLLSDLKLPRLSGFDVLRWLRDQDSLRRIPAVILTSSRQRRDIDTAYDCGASAYLVKPIETQILVDVFRSLHSFWAVHNTGPHVSLRPAAR